MLNQKTNWKFILIILILSAIVGGGILDYLRYFEKEMESLSKFPEIKKLEKPVQNKKEENYISITHSGEKEKNILVFDINLQNYSVTSGDLSRFGEEFKNLGSELIVPPEFNISSKIPFVKIETNTENAPCKPEIPYLMAEITLPLSTKVESKLENIEEEKIKEKIEIVPGITCRKWGGCVACPDYLKDNQFFPEKIFVSQDIRKFDTYSLARIYLPLFGHNPATRETYMVKKANIKVNYKLPLSLVLTEFSMDKTKYSAGETINASVKVGNVGLESINDLQARLTLITPQGKTIFSASSSKFNLKSEEFKEIPINLTLGEGFQSGNYLAKVEIVDNKENILGTSSKYIYLSSGEIIKFSLPKEVEEGKTIEFEISFKNEESVEVEAVGHVTVYDSKSINRYVLSSDPIKVKPKSTVSIKISWNTWGKKPGKWTALPWISIGEKEILSNFQEFVIKAGK